MTSPRFRSLPLAALAWPLLVIPIALLVAAAGCNRAADQPAEGREKAVAEGPLPKVVIERPGATRTPIWTQMN